MKTLWRVLRWLLLLLVVYIGGILLYGTLTDWQPRGTESAAVLHPPPPGAPVLDSTLTLVSWNLGYGGLGAENYFFYNRGDFFWTEPGTVRTTPEQTERYVAGQALITQSTLSDVFLFQEVDTAGRRSHYVNMAARLMRARPEYAATYAPNFQSDRVPIPLFQPWDHYGYVHGGLLTLSKFSTANAERIQLPGEYGWPTRLFQLDRCALRQLLPDRGRGELALYNVHLSAYDADGSIRRRQMDYLRELVLEDYAAGRYVVVGGDWNQLPPGFNFFSLNPGVERIEQPITIGFDFMPAGWKYAYDPTVATVRESTDPFTPGGQPTSVIDFFLVSPNLRILNVKGLEQQFAHSDHQPVYTELELLR